MANRTGIWTAENYKKNRRGRRLSLPFPDGSSSSPDLIRKKQSIFTRDRFPFWRSWNVWAPCSRSSRGIIQKWWGHATPPFQCFRHGKNMTRVRFSFHSQYRYCRMTQPTLWRSGVFGSGAQMAAAHDRQSFDWTDFLDGKNRASLRGAILNWLLQNNQKEYLFVRGDLCR